MSFNDTLGLQCGGRKDIKQCGLVFVSHSRLKTVNLVLKNTQAAEALVKLYETKLCEEEAVIADKNNIENLMSTLKVRVSLLAVAPRSRFQSFSSTVPNVWH